MSMIPLELCHHMVACHDGRPRDGNQVVEAVAWYVEKFDGVQVAYVTRDIRGGIAECCRRGFQFVADASNTNAIGEQVLYFDTDSSMRSRMHFTQLPA